METDKIPTNKFLRVVADSDDTDTDNSALYYSAIENSTSQIYHDDSTLEADHEITLEKTMEKTVKHTKTPTPMNSPAVKRMANSPLLLSGRKNLPFKFQAGSSTPHTMPDIARGFENDINLVNQTKFSKLALDFKINDAEKEETMEIVNQQLEQVKLELPMKPNWRFTSPSNPAYSVPEATKEPSPGQIQFEKTANRVSADYEDLNAVQPPMTGRPSMAIEDFQEMRQLFKIKTPAKRTVVVETESEPEITPEVVKPPKTLEQAFEKMASEMQNSSIDEIVTKEVSISQLPKRTSISAAYRNSAISKANSLPGPSNIPAAVKRATWATRQTTYTLPEIPETKSEPIKKDLPIVGVSKLATRKSYLPTTRPVATSTGVVKKRQSLYPATLKPATNPLKKPEIEKKTKTTALKIATVKIGNRRSSFGNPVGKPNVRKSMLPSRASPKPIRRSMMPPPASTLVRNGAQSHTGAIPKQTLTKTVSKSDLMCKYCDKKFAIAKGLDDHLLLKCPKIPPKDKKKLLSQDYAARELENSRRTLVSRSASKTNAMDSLEGSCSSIASGSSMPPPSKLAVPKSNKAGHTGVLSTPNKQITCMACGMKFCSAYEYTVHMTSLHFPKQDSMEEDVNGN